MALGYATPVGNGTFKLSYSGGDPRAYFPSTYSYAIAQTTGFDPAKGKALATYLNYAVCKGQERAEPLAYSRLSVQLVDIALDATAKIPGAPPRPPTATCGAPPPPSLQNAPAAAKKAAGSTAAGAAAAGGASAGGAAADAAAAEAAAAETAAAEAAAAEAAAAEACGHRGGGGGPGDRRGRGPGRGVDGECRAGEQRRAVHPAARRGAGRHRIVRVPRDQVVVAEAVRRVRRPGRRVLIRSALVAVAGLWVVLPSAARAQGGAVQPDAVSFQGELPAEARVFVDTAAHVLDGAATKTQIDYVTSGSQGSRRSFIEGRSDFTISGVPFSQAELADLAKSGRGLIGAPVQAVGLQFFGFVPPLSVFPNKCLDPDSDCNPNVDRVPYAGTFRFTSGVIADLYYERTNIWARPDMGQNLDIDQANQFLFPPIRGARPVVRSDADAYNYYLDAYLAVVEPEVRQGRPHPSDGPDRGGTRPVGGVAQPVHTVPPGHGQRGGPHPGGPGPRLQRAVPGRDDRLRLPLVRHGRLHAEQRPTGRPAHAHVPGLHPERGR